MRHPRQSEIRWFADDEAFLTFSAAVAPASRAVEAHIGRCSTFPGYCCKCRGVVDFRVNGGALFGDHPNLREGMICPNCGLNNRQRLMFHAVTSELAGRTDARVLLLERFSRLHEALQDVLPSLTGTEFLGPRRKPGEVVNARGIDVRHESATDLSFADDSLDVVVHTDVLEHIPEYRTALRESFRVLRPGGALMFSCPFFETRSETLVRATVGLDGAIQHLEPAEIHGDPLGEEGILAFYHFGWTLLDDVRGAGFPDVRIGVHYDPMAGLTGNNYGYDQYGRMLPLLFRAEK